jgi:putative YhdH/YhfP family quinone oxidoreductase
MSDYASIDTSNPFQAFRIHAERDKHRAGIEEMKVDDLSPGEVVIKVAYSSVNYKDALAGTGKGRILRESPLNGGIDVAGYVAASTDPAFKEGDQVLCTGSGLSETRDGGYAQFARLQAKWTIPLPAGLTLRESMILGTAGFTAALSLYRMQQNGQTPDMGPIVVTGATGGVGSGDRHAHERRLRSARHQRQARAFRRPHRPGRQAVHLAQGSVLGPASA